MLGGLTNRIVGGEPIKSLTISLRTVESEIANSLTKVQNDNKEVEIGSYPFFHAGKLGVSIVLRSEYQSKIDLCNSQILEFIKKYIDHNRMFEQAMDKKIGMFYKSMGWTDVVDKQQSIERFF